MCVPGFTSRIVRWNKSVFLRLLCYCGLIWSNFLGLVVNSSTMSLSLSRSREYIRDGHSRLLGSRDARDVPLLLSDAKNSHPFPPPLPALFLHFSGVYAGTLHKWGHKMINGVRRKHAAVQDAQSPRQPGLHCPRCPRWDLL